MNNPNEPVLCHGCIAGIEEDGDWVQGQIIAYDYNHIHPYKDAAPQLILLLLIVFLLMRK